MTAAFALLALWATIWIAPETPAARFIHRCLAEVPLGALERVSRGHVVVALTIVSLLLMLAWLGEEDGVRALSMAAPDAWAWLTTFEVSAYLDALAALVAASSALGFKTLKSRLSRGCGSPPRALRATPRPRCSRRRVMIPANDDEDGAAFALAS